MKKIGLGLVLGAVGFSNSLNPVQDDKASILINWSNNKGESKVFKIDDLEKDNGDEKIHSKTLLQRYVKQSCIPSYRKYRVRSGSKGRSRSKSGGFCGKKRGSRSKSGEFCGKRRGSRSKSGEFCGKRRGSRSYSRGSRNEGSCDVKCGRSISRSGSCKVRKPVVIEHRPIYKRTDIYMPKKKQNKFYNNAHRMRSESRDSESEKCYSKDVDKNCEKLRLDDLLKLYKLNKIGKKSKSCEKRSLSKKKTSKSMSKYAKDKNSKFLKDNIERSCSREDINTCQSAKQDKDFHQNSKEGERQHENEMKKCHNIVNMADKKNEALLMKEKAKDNLHSSDKVIEEFDKLEHFKKVEERCRSASKARRANVKKNDCMDKEQKQHAGQKMKEKRSNKKIKSANEKSNNDFDFFDKNRENRKSQFMKLGKECEAEKEKERSCSASKKYDKFSQDSNRKSCEQSDYLDLLNKKNHRNKSKSCIGESKDEDYHKKSRSGSRSRCLDDCETKKLCN